MIKFAYVSRSARGSVRKDNQDSVLCLEERGVFAVADGMGGGAEGARASQMVCAALKDGVAGKDFSERMKTVESAVVAANQDIFGYAEKNGLRQMGSTVSVLLLDLDRSGRAAIAYAGDSRVYRLRAGKAELLTRDHSIGAELEAKVGGKTGAQFSVRSNPLAHVLTRAVGTEADLTLEWRKIDVRPADRFLICTDGVHDVIETSELEGLLAAGKVEAAAGRLEDEVLKRGAPDNYSFVLVEIGGAA